MSESVAILCDAMRGGSGDVPVPSCLNQCRNSEMFHCKVRENFIVKSKMSDWIMNRKITIMNDSAV